MAQQRANISVLAALAADLIFKLQQDPEAEYPGWCSTTNAELGSMFGVSPRSAARLLAELTQTSLIETNGQSNDRRCLRTTAKYFRSFVIDNMSAADSAVPNLHGTLIESDSAAPIWQGTPIEANPAVPNLHGTMADEDSAVPIWQGVNPETTDPQNPETLSDKGLEVPAVPIWQGTTENRCCADSTLVESNIIITIEEDSKNNNIISEKTKKKSAATAKFPDGFFAQCRTRYEVWREVNGWQPEYFTAKEIGSLRNLINAVSHSIRTIDAAGSPCPTDFEEVYTAFDAFFSAMPQRILQQPIGLAQLYSRYNEILNEQHYCTQLYSPQIEAVIEAFKGETKSLSPDYLATDTERKAVLDLHRLFTASAAAKTPNNPNPTQEQLTKWSSILFRKIATLEWWATRTGSIAFVVKNYNNIATAIAEAGKPATSPAIPAVKGKIVPHYGTEIGWSNPKAAAIFNGN